jgi:hypothetical protein
MGTSKDEREQRALRIVGAVIRHLLNEDQDAAIQLLDDSDIISTRSDVIDIVIMMSRLYGQQLIMMANGDEAKVRAVVDGIVNLGHGLSFPGVPPVE